LAKRMMTSGQDNAWDVVLLTGVAAARCCDLVNSDVIFALLAT